MFKIRGFLPNPDAQREIEKSAAVATGLNTTAEEIVKRAADNAPRGRRHPGWAGSFRAVPAEEIDGKMTAYAVSDHPVATIIEFGSAKNPPYRTLTRAAQSVGHFEDELG